MILIRLRSCPKSKEPRQTLLQRTCLLVSSFLCLQVPHGNASHNSWCGKFCHPFSNTHMDEHHRHHHHHHNSCLSTSTGQSLIKSRETSVSTHKHEHAHAPSLHVILFCTTSSYTILVFLNLFSIIVPMQYMDCLRQ